MHFVYILQNKINNKIYVGYSSNPEKRWKSEKSASSLIKDRSYNSLLSRAIRKYGWDNFSKSIIEEWHNLSDALDAEKFWIEFFRTNVSRYGNDCGYNRNEGGNLPPNPEGRIIPEEIGKKISESKKGVRLSQFHKESLSKAKFGNRALSAIQSLEIQISLKSGKLLAEEYNVSEYTISRLKNKKIKRNKFSWINYT